MAACKCRPAAWLSDFGVDRVRRQGQALAVADASNIPETIPDDPCPVTGSLCPSPLRQFVREDVLAISLARRKIVGYRIRTYDAKRLYCDFRQAENGVERAQREI